MIQHLNTHGWRVYGLGKQILTWKDAKKVRGKLRQLLNDLIKTKHNSNHKTQQITLEGVIVQEYYYKALGFVPSDVVRLKKDVWFSILEQGQIAKIIEYLRSIRGEKWWEIKRVKNYL